MDVIKELDKLSPKPGDIIVLKVSKNAPPEILEEISAMLAVKFGKIAGKVLLLVIQDDEDIKIMPEKEMNRYGYGMTPSWPVSCQSSVDSA